MLLVDEAHTLDRDVGHALLQASQQVSRNLPFLLVLAGTPQLEARLNAMDASFSNRSEQVRVGRLTRAAAGEALRRPLEREGIAPTDAALREMVAASQCCPYFIQLVGRAVWGHANSATEGGSPAFLARFDDAPCEFQQTRDEYYAQRFEEMADARLLPVAAAVARAFADRDVLSRHLEQSIAHGLGDAGDEDAAAGAFETLRDLGYVWRVSALPEWEPGIPSLMDYVRKHAPGA